MSKSAIFSLACLGVALGAPTSFVKQADERVPVPEAAALKEAEKLIRELFKEEYKKTSALDQQALARKLLQEAIRTTDDKSSQYCLLRESQDLAAKSGDSETVLRAIDEMSKHFKVSAPALKYATLSAAAKSAKTPEEMIALARAQSKGADEAMALDEYDTAEKMADAAGSLARKSKDQSLANRADSKKKEILSRKARYEKVKKSKETLVGKPDDGDANFIVGHYDCFVKGNWDAGLPLLAKGSDPVLRSLAAKDLSKQTDDVEQALVGDGWWELAQKESGTIRAILRQRAAYWYEQAAPRLAGLGKVKIEKNLAEWREERLGPKNLWILVTDPRQFGETGKDGDPITLSGAAASPPSAMLKESSGNYEGFSARVSVPDKRRSHPGLLFEHKRRMLYIDAGNDAFLVAHREEKDQPVGWYNDCH